VRFRVVRDAEQLAEEATRKGQDQNRYVRVGDPHVNQHGDGRAEQRLDQQGLELPRPAPPVAPCRRARSLSRSASVTGDSVTAIAKVITRVDAPDVEVVDGPTLAPQEAQRHHEEDRE
jgi:hypothetical protein